MIVMKELLKDPVYKKFILTTPKSSLIINSPSPEPQWRVYVKRTPDSNWARKDFKTYKKAFKFFRKWLQKGAYDLTIHNRRIETKPPSYFVRIKGRYVTGSDGIKRQATKKKSWVVKLLPEEEQHEWCLYCRRPTTFRFYSKHPALSLPEVDSSVRRCCICGGSERIAVSRGN